MNSTVSTGTTVSVHYRGTLEDGEEFDSSYSRSEPLTFTAGSGQMIAGFDEAVIGMTVGESKTFTVSPEDGYGEHFPDRTTEMPRSAFPADFDLSDGAQVPLMGPGDRPLIGSVLVSTPAAVTVDLNHPLAGKTLKFEIEVVTSED
jgi:peptidylprolyl isomerase|tara:strand:+ start:1127 stop:1564 length:438 start_codon:yes stop_codon:yes gene_type:complete